GGDLLDEPQVAVRVAERDPRAVGRALRGRAVRPPGRPAVVEYPARVVEDLAYLGAVAGQLGPGRLDVVGDQLHALGRTGRGGRDIGAEDDRAGRAGRGYLYQPEVRPGREVGVQAPAQPGVEGLGPVHVGDRQHHDLEPQVHDRVPLPAG